MNTGHAIAPLGPLSVRPRFKSLSMAYKAGYNMIVARKRIIGRLMWLRDYMLPDDWNRANALPLGSVSIAK